MAPSQLDDRSQQSGPILNPVRVLERVFRFWYLMVISVAAGLAVAWALNRYTERIYPVSASLIVKENTDNIGARFLYNNNIINSRRNYFNEFYIMRSIPLMQKVVEDLRLDVTWVMEGEIRSTELFMPGFQIKFLPAHGGSLPYGRLLRIRFDAEDQYQLEDEQGKPVTGSKYGDTLTVAGNRFYIRKDAELGSEWIGRELLVRFVNPFQLASRYAKNLNLSWSQQGAAVIDVSINGPVPSRLVAFLDRFVFYYQQYDVEQKSLVATKSLEFLDQQIDVIGDSLRYYESRLALSELRNLAGADIQPQRLSSLYGNVDEADLKIRLQERYYAYLESYMNSRADFSQVLLPSSLGVADPVLAGLVSKLADLQFQLKVLQGQAESAANPLVQESREKISLYKREIEEGIRSAREIMRINRNLQAERLKELEESVNKRPDVDKDLAHLNRNYKLNEGLYTVLIQKRAEAAISQASTTSDLVLLNNPRAGEPITPKPARNYLIGFLVGLLLPLVLFVILELLNNKVQSKEDIESLSAIPVCGTIGHADNVSSLAVLDKPRSFVSESFRALRSNLNFLTEGKERRAILVTSTIPGEGKSFTSINVATVLAFTGKRTILIAGDMRKTTMAADFGVTNQNGLSLVLTGQEEVSSAIVTTKVPGLDFMPAGPTPPNPAELFMGPKFSALLEELRGTYENIIVDSPPIGVVSDALELIPNLDHVLFVVRQNYTPLSAIRQLQLMVEQGQVAHISIVLNDIIRVGMGYGYKYGYGYDYGYGYRYGEGGYYRKSSKDKGYGDEAYE